MKTELDPHPHRNPNTPTDNHSRREFLRRGLRLAVLTAGAGVAALFVKRGHVTATEQSCVNEGICSGCRTYSTCRLPQAMSRRRKLGEPDRR